jgi:hypothetical protein
MRALESLLGGLSFILILATLLACGGGAKHMTASDGRAAIKIKCKSERTNCLVEASAACGSSGYHVLDEESHSGGIAADILPGPVPWWTMMVRCGQAPADHLEPPKAAPSITPLPTVAATPAAQPAPVYQPVSPAPAPAQAPAQVAAGCSSDFSCPPGYRCTKDSYAMQGVCARTVNEYATPTYTPPSPASVGPGTGDCQFDTQCPIGFRCKRNSNGLYGNCMK